MSNAIVLQSGFIARSITLDKLVRNNSEMPNNYIIAVVKLGKIFMKEQTDFYYNGDIDELFYTLEKERSRIKKFEFRELIIKEIFDCFGRDGKATIIDWFKLQSHSPLMTENHLAFMEKLINLMLPETSLSMSNRYMLIENSVSFNIYEQLVIPSPNENKLVMESLRKYPTLFSLFSNKSVNTEVYSNSSLLQTALVKENGFFDLLYAAKIIFGNTRQIRLSSSNNPHY